MLKKKVESDEELVSFVEVANAPLNNQLTFKCYLYYLLHRVVVLRIKLRT